MKLSFLLLAVILLSTSPLKSQENGLAIQLNLNGSYLWGQQSRFDMQAVSASLVVFKYDERRFLFDRFIHSNPDFHQFRYRFAWQDFRFQRTNGDSSILISLDNAFLFESSRKIYSFNEKFSLYYGNELIWYQSYQKSLATTSNEVLDREIGTGIILTFFPMILINISEKLYLELASPIRFGQINSQITIDPTNLGNRETTTNIRMFDGIGFRFGLGLKL